jgi:hypothetical protein
MANMTNESMGLAALLQDGFSESEEERERGMEKGAQQPLAIKDERDLQDEKKEKADEGADGLTFKKKKRKRVSKQGDLKLTGKKSVKKAKKKQQ